MTEAELNLAAIKRVYWLVQNACDQLCAEYRHSRAEDVNEAWELIVTFIEYGDHNG